MNIDYDENEEVNARPRKWVAERNERNYSERLMRVSGPGLRLELDVLHVCVVVMALNELRVDTNINGFQ